MIDKKKLAEIKDLMDDGFDDFIQLFLQELENDIDIIVSTKDNSTILLKSHSQKSSCALVGATEMAKVFLEIEQLAKENKNADELISQLPQLLLEVKQVL